MRYIMVSCLYGITLGLALSVDAFMLSLVYGTTCKRKIENLFTSILVGFFHFTLLIIGYLLASLVFSSINLATYFQGKARFISFLILVMIGFMMIFKNDTKYTSIKHNILSKFLFAFSVSFDSFLTGIAFTTINHINIIIVAIFISIISSTITLTSLSLGKKTRDRFLNKNLEFYAGILIIILAVIALFI